MRGKSFQDRQDVFVLKRADQLQALGARATHDVFMGLLKIGEGSIAEIASAINKTPHGLYHHMDKLQSVGLVLPAGTRRSGARMEQIYRPVAHLLRTDPENDDPDYLAALAKNARADFRRAGMAASHALETGLARRKDGEANIASLQITVPLNDDQRRELLTRLNAIVDELTADQIADPDAPTHLLTLGLSPLE